MYKVEVEIYQRGRYVTIDAEMYEISSGGDPVSLGSIPTQWLHAPSRGHDWMGDVLDALAKWAEMSLFPRRVDPGEPLF